MARLPVWARNTFESVGFSSAFFISIDLLRLKIVKNFPKTYAN
ncbi:hypothetical protein HMPREF1582_01414 [Gardnerella vaginalis JCP8151A]|nr:hypothetical protein HMPREF1582_01414 [Gardnerella vaginalis JCP8151A]